MSGKLQNQFGMKNIIFIQWNERAKSLSFVYYQVYTAQCSFLYQVEEQGAKLKTF